MNILAIGTERVISKKVLEELKQKSDFSVIICTPKQVKNIAAINYDVMYVDMLHLGMDEEFEGIIDQAASADDRIPSAVATSRCLQTADDLAYRRNP